MIPSLEIPLTFEIQGVNDLMHDFTKEYDVAHGVAGH